VPLEVTDRLRTLATEHLAAFAASGAFDAFSDAVFEYGRLAGECFATCQGGPFATPTIADLVETLRRLSVQGVGQSSWGPTVFALARDEDHATQIGTQLQRDPLGRECDVTITEPCHGGARIVRQAFQPDGQRRQGF
jgi:predicted sugar kinase